MEILLNVWIVFQILLELCLHSETSQCVHQETATLKYTAQVWWGGGWGAFYVEVLEGQLKKHSPLFS